MPVRAAGFWQKGTRAADCRWVVHWASATGTSERAVWRGSRRGPPTFRDHGTSHSLQESLTVRDNPRFQRTAATPDAVETHMSPPRNQPGPKRRAPSPKVFPTKRRHAVTRRETALPIAGRACPAGTGAIPDRSECPTREAVVRSPQAAGGSGSVRIHPCTCLLSRLGPGGSETGRAVRMQATTDSGKNGRKHGGCRAPVRTIPGRGLPGSRKADAFPTCIAGPPVPARKPRRAAFRPGRCHDGRPRRGTHTGRPELRTDGTAAAQWPAPAAGAGDIQSRVPGRNAGTRDCRTRTRPADNRLHRH